MAKTLSARRKLSASAPRQIRSEILQAAANAFLEQGFASTTVDAIADTLGATKGRIYHYYRNKSDLVVAIHLESLRILTERVGVAATLPGLGPAERLYRMCYAHAAGLMSDTAYHQATTMGLGRTLMSFRAREPAAGTEQVKLARRSYEKLFAGVLVDGSAAGIFRAEQPGMLTKPLLGALNWTNLWFRATADPEQIHQLAHGLATYCVKAVLATPGSCITGEIP